MNRLLSRPVLMLGLVLVACGDDPPLTGKAGDSGVDSATGTGGTGGRRDGAIDSRVGTDAPGAGASGADAAVEVAPAMDAVAVTEDTAQGHPDAAVDAAAVDVQTGADAATGGQPGTDAHAPDVTPPVTCTTASTCPGQDNECGARTCSNGVCGYDAVPSGVAAETQTAGDCRTRQCDGKGAVVVVNNDVDLPDDGNPCTANQCMNGSPVHPLASKGAACGGGNVCDAAGHCVGCNAASDCPGQDLPCQVRTCSAEGACGLRNLDSGVLAAGQVAGDCHADKCDGNGHVMSVVDDADKPVDGNDCTEDVCNAGVKSNPATAPNSACGTGQLCDGAGHCTGCTTAASCPGSDTACRTRTCNNGMCGLAFTAAGPLAAGGQVTGDCKRIRCDGAGNLVTEADDSDKPVDSNQCTDDVCAGGLPSNPALSMGSVCTQNGGSRCNGAANRPLCVPTVRVLRVGDGVAPLTLAAATSVFVDELIPAADGTLLSTLNLPTAAAGATHPLTLSGSADSEGQLARSSDGKFLALAGYAAAPGFAGVASSDAGGASMIQRVVARIDASGSIDTSTLLGAVAFSKDNVRGAITADGGTGFWMVGNGDKAVNAGVWYAPLGGTPVQLLTAPKSTRAIQIAGGQLYATAATNTFTFVSAIGTGLPTTAGQTAAVLPTATTIDGQSPFAFALLDRDGVPGLDTLYVADDRLALAGGGVQKWTWNGSAWARVATFSSGAVGVRGLTAFVSGSSVTVVATTAPADPSVNGNAVVLFDDDGVSSPAPVTIRGAVNGKSFYRGVALSPVP